MKAIKTIPKLAANGRASSSVKPKRRRERPSTTATLELVPALLKLDSILVPIDFSVPSKKALRYAAAFARQFGARITVLSVVEPVMYPDFAYFPLSLENDEVVKKVKTQLESLCRGQRLDTESPPRTLVRVGSPFQEICAAAAREKADLIIIATHGYTGFKHAWLGSTAERVVRHAPCPVLVVRERGKEFVTR